MMKIFCDSNGIKYNGDKISLSLDPKTAHDGINFTSHAHMDHLPSARSAGTVLCTHETMEIAKIRNRDIQNSIQHYDGTEMIDSCHILGGRGFPVVSMIKIQAIKYGVKFSGCTVHFVDSGVDTGPIILQSVVSIDEGDTVKTLSDKILRKEHKLYPQAVELLASRKIRIYNNIVLKNNGVY